MKNNLNPEPFYDSNECLTSRFTAAVDLNLIGLKMHD